MPAARAQCIGWVTQRHATVANSAGTPSEPAASSEHRPAPDGLGAVRVAREDQLAADGRRDLSCAQGAGQDAVMPLREAGCRAFAAEVAAGRLLAVQTARA